MILPSNDASNDVPRTPAWRVAVGIFAGLTIGIFTWAYWHVVSHAVVHVAIDDIARRTDKQAHGSVTAADVVFHDVAGAQLARGASEPPWGNVVMIHPSVGDCRRAEQQGGTVWQQCFEAQSRWLITWVRRAHHARVTVGTCTIDRVPVAMEESRDAWWLWWVPLPHIDNSTYTHFTLTLRIDSAQCEAAV